MMTLDVRVNEMASKPEVAPAGLSQPLTQFTVTEPLKKSILEDIRAHYSHVQFDIFHPTAEHTVIVTANGVMKADVRINLGSIGFWGVGEGCTQQDAVRSAYLDALNSSYHGV